jgi:Cu+-exporting ATPase
VQQLADKISSIFVPTVLCIAAATAIGWWFYGQSQHWPSGTTWAHIANAACSVLIIACPCALGLALPAALMVGTGMGARRGILFRDIDVLQIAEKIDTVVLDKTGTITQGKPDVQSVVASDGMPEEELLALAASAEQFSSHPLAKALVNHARSRQLKLTDPSDFSSEAGLGVTATIGGKTFAVGSAAMLEKFGGTAKSDLGTIVYVAEKRDSAIHELGQVIFADPVKSESAQAIARLQALNLRTVLLTGDSPSVAATVSSAVGIQEFHAGVKPGGKAEFIRKLQSGANPTGNGNKKASVVAMVGDGINDAPALAAADLGIAIGSGSDIAKETGGIILISGNLRGVASAILLSRATMRCIRQNLFLAFIYNVLAIPLAAFGLLNPLIAAGAMALSDVTVIGNALRLRRSKID